MRAYSIEANNLNLKQGILIKGKVQYGSTADLLIMVACFVSRKTHIFFHKKNLTERASTRRSTVPLLSLSLSCENSLVEANNEGNRKTN
jgi:hypothetical protein